MERETKTNILFLDACRNNPLTRNLARALGTRSADIGRGLAPAESGVGTLISFSTQPGNVALDGSGRNSPYSGPLAKAIGTPGEDILSVLTAVRNEVLAATNEKQVPWENHALRARFYFNPAAPAAAQPQTPLSPDAQAWSLVQGTTSEAVLEEFIRRFPNSVYASFANARLDELREARLPPTMPKQPATVETQQSRKETLSAESAYQQAVEKAQANQDAEAVRLYRIAAEQGHVVAMHNLAVRLYLGKGTHQDGIEALRWYRLAAKGGYGESMFVLASRYAKGVDVTQDLNEAAHWMVEAIKHHSKYAFEEMTTKFESWNIDFRVAFQRELALRSSYAAQADGTPNSEMQRAIVGLMRR